MFLIEEELKKLPAKPGVYLMHDERDEICMFSGGGHPAILSNAEQAAEAIRKFLSRADAKSD